MNLLFEDAKVIPSSRLSLGREKNTGTFYIACPFITANRMLDYEKYFTLTSVEYSLFLNDEAAAIAFAAKCLLGEMDHRLLHPVDY